jgi:hypothetical protein
VGAAVVVAAAGAAGAWAWHRNRTRKDLLRALAAKVGNPALSPDNQPVEDILLEIQVTYDLTADGKWNAETEAKIRELLAESPAPASNPASQGSELEPDEDWEQLYEARLPAALDACRDADCVIAFDQAVIYLLDETFPEAGGFQLNPATGAWKRQARERARYDLVRHLGSTEAEARASLTARTVGRQALAQGADLGQAVRAMGQHAFPHASWEGHPRNGWQRLFSERAASELRAM